MNKKDPTDAFNDIVKDSVDNVVELPTGQKEFGDLIEFYKVVDFFGDRYGMGACKSLEEFAKMIDETDPVLRAGLYNVGVSAENKKWGGEEAYDKSSPAEHDSDTPNHVVVNHDNNTHRRPNTSKSVPVQINGSLGMRNFLNEFGADNGEVKKACEKISHRKITLKDYSFVDKYYLKDISEEEFKELLKDMRNEQKKSINFEVSDDTLRQKLKKQNGK